MTAANDLGSNATQHSVNSKNPRISSKSPRVALTRWTAPGPVTKKLHLSNFGEVQKTSTASNLYEGDVKVIECSPRVFQERLLPKLTVRQSTSYGIPATQHAKKLTTKGLLTADLAAQGYIARNKENMVWPEGPAIMMIDYDPDAGSELSREGLLDSLYGLIPGLKGYAHVHWYSSSSYIRNGKTEEQLTEAKGQRVYIFVQSGADIPRAAHVLFSRAWLKGYGRIKVSSSGQLLTRCALFDNAVFQPSRIDFVADPVCHPPIESCRPLPTLHGDESLLLDTTQALPDLSDEEKCRYDALVVAEKAKHAAEAAKVKVAWVAGRVTDAVARGVDRYTAEAIFSAATEQNILGPEFELISSEGEIVAVEAVLSAPEKYHQQRFRDPLEPDYRDDERIAIAYTLGGHPIIYSHAHGGCKYRLQGEKLSATPSSGKRNTELQKIAEHLGQRCLVFADGGIVYRLTKEGRLEQLDVPKAMRLIDTHVELYKPTKKDGLVPIDCTEQLGKLFIGAHASDLAQVSAAVRQPILDPQTGEILSKSGYYPQQHCLIVECEPFSDVPNNPTMAQVADALKTIWYPVSQFAYVGPEDQSVVLGAMLTALVRPLLPTSPAFAIDAPVQGSGKTLLATTIAALSGDEVTLLPPLNQDKEDEVRKRLLSSLREKRPVMLIDNIVGDFDSPSLAALLTSQKFSDRELGVSRIVSVTPRALMLMTGNNLCFRGDMARRVYVARIDPKVESPHQREFDFDPGEYFARHRQALVRAGLALMRAFWVRCDDKRYGAGRTASFEVWDDCVRQTVCWLAQLQQEGKLPTGPSFPTLCDPNVALNEAIQTDPEVAKLERVLFSIVQAVGFNKAMTCRDLIVASDATHILGKEYEVPLSAALELRGALADVAGDAKRSEPNPRSLGKWFAKHKDRLIHGVVLREGRKRNGSATWYVEDCGGKGLQGFDGFEPEDALPQKPYAA